jgi:hypothetical protein
MNKTVMICRKGHDGNNGVLNVERGVITHLSKSNYEAIPSRS